MDIKQRAGEIKDYIIEMRRHLHMNPELSFEEFATTDFIAGELTGLGIPYQRFEGTGLVGWVQGRGEGPCVGLRADLDALNVTEATGAAYQSKTPGKMHACGHDAHAAMLLGAAKILNEAKDSFNGKIALIFQPGEELAAGAKKIIPQGDWFSQVDNFFGIHIWSLMPSGKVSVEAGPRMAAGDIFEIKIKGKSGHASMPHQGTDALLIASHMVVNLQSIVSRETNPMEPLVISVGTIKAGTRFNVIADEAFLDGTTRYFSRELGKTIVPSMERIVKGTAEMFNATAELNYRFISPPVINEAGSSKIAAGAAAKIMGEDAVVTESMTTGGEDFSNYIETKPGCFALLGSADPAKGTDFPHHSAQFNVDEDVLPHGAGLYAQYALDFLAGGAV